MRKKFKEDIKVKEFNLLIPTELLAKLKFDGLVNGKSEADIVRELLYKKYGFEKERFEKGSNK